MSKWTIVLTTLVIVLAGAATYAGMQSELSDVDDQEIERGACTENCG